MENPLNRHNPFIVIYSIENSINSHSEPVVPSWAESFCVVRTRIFRQVMDALAYQTSIL